MINLTQREKNLIIALGALVSGLVLIFIIILPVVSFIKQSQEETIAKQTNLGKLDKIYEEYRGIDQKIKDFEALMRNTKSLASMIEEKSEADGILTNKVYIRDNPGGMVSKYRRVSTDVRFEGVDMEKLLKFMYDMENSNKIVRISYLRISPTIKGRNTYDAQIKFDSFTE
jgi:hypothetical protein